jgi:AraC-like DNA-binding protein
MKGDKRTVPQSEPCYSVRLIRPFLDRLAETPLAQNDVAKKVIAMGDDERLPVRQVLRWLDAAVKLTGDPNLGLRAARQMGRGAGDVLEFAAASAGTFGQAMRSVLRYIHILNEAADFQLQIREPLACVELHSRVPLSRASADFQVAAIVRGARAWLGSLEGFEIWFSYPEPKDLSVYEKAFEGARLRFSAPYDAITFDSRLLEAPLRGADPALHAVLCRHADQLVSALPQNDSLSPRVRKLLLELLPSGSSDATRVAGKLGMSRRTLTRHLEREGVTYKELLEKARHQMALQYLEKSNLDPQQIAFMLGYSVTAAFSRAFARWEGKSPTEHRRTYRASQRN